MRFHRTMARAVALAVPLAAMTSPAWADTLFSDGFEGGNFNAWTAPVTAGDGTVALQSATVKSGSAAAQLTETANAGSKAYLRKTLSSTQQDLTISGAFN